MERMSTNSNGVLSSTSWNSSCSRNINHSNNSNNSSNSMSNVTRNSCRTTSSEWSRRRHRQQQEQEQQQQQQPHHEQQSTPVIAGSIPIIPSPSRIDRIASETTTNTEDTTSTAGIDYNSTDSSEQVPPPIDMLHYPTNTTMTIPTTGEVINAKNTLQSFSLIMDDAAAATSVYMTDGVSCITENSASTTMSSAGRSRSSRTTLSRSVLGTPISVTSRSADGFRRIRSSFSTVAILQQQQQQQHQRQQRPSSYNSNNSNNLTAIATLADSSAINPATGNQNVTLITEAIPITCVPEVEAYVVPSMDDRSRISTTNRNNDMKKNHAPTRTWWNRLICVCIFLFVLVVTGIAVLIITSKANGPPTATNTKVPSLSQQIAIREFLLNRTLSSRSDENDTTAEDYAIDWLTTNFFQDSWYSTGATMNISELNEVLQVDIVLQTKLIQQYVLLILWFQQQHISTEDHKTVESWIQSDGWLRTNDECQWYGITCTTITIPVPNVVSNNTDHYQTDVPVNVITDISFVDPNMIDQHDNSNDDDSISNERFGSSIRIVGNNFTGTLPVDLALLSHIRTMNFMYNNIHGAIPSSIGEKWSNMLEFNVRNNHITGSIPTSLQRWTKLNKFHVQNNQLSGRIDRSFSKWRQLIDFSVKNNLLIGSIPPKMNWFEMVSFDISNNDITGSIPNLSWNQLSSFDVSNNLMTGSIPQAMQNWTNLIEVNLSNNSFTGTLPIWIGDGWKNISSFTISNNSFTGVMPQLRTKSISSSRTEIDLSNNLLQGSIPEWLGQIPNLVYLNLNNNRFNGTLPSSLGDCTMLSHISLGTNALFGTIPDSWKMLTSMRLFDISSNAIMGSVPSWIGQWRYLTTFITTKNRINGTMPDSIGMWQDIITFDVSMNQLQGSLPKGIERWSDLTHFDVSYNKFTGTIPKGIGGPYFDHSFVVVQFQNNTFNGTIPICPIPKSNEDKKFVQQLKADCDETNCTCCTECFVK